MFVCCILILIVCCICLFLYCDYLLVAFVCLCRQILAHGGRKSHEPISINIVKTVSKIYLLACWQYFLLIVFLHCCQCKPFVNSGISRNWKKILRNQNWKNKRKICYRENNTLLQGNLEMTLASRLSTAANLGRLDK